MNRHKRRRARVRSRITHYGRSSRPAPPEDAGRFEDAIRHMVDRVLLGAGPAPHVVIGPIVWRPNGTERDWYFCVASADTKGEFRVDSLSTEADRELAEESRCALVMEFINRRPVVMHDFDDELNMAKFCEALWPCEKTIRIRERRNVSGRPGWNSA